MQKEFKVEKQLAQTAIIGFVGLLTLLFVAGMQLDREQEANQAAKLQIKETEKLVEARTLDSLKAEQHGELLQEALEKSQSQVTELQNSIQLAAQATGGWNVTPAEITAYSPLDDRNGINSDGEGETTSTGLKAGYGIFAVDPKRIPYGSKIVIIYENGTIEEGIAGDTGGAMRSSEHVKIDVFRRTFDEAITFGDPQATVLWKASVE